MPYTVNQTKIAGFIVTFLGIIFVILGLILSHSNGFEFNTEFFTFYGILLLVVAGPTFFIDTYIIAPREKKRQDEVEAILKSESDALYRARMRNLAKGASPETHFKKYRVYYSPDAITGKCPICKLSLYASEDILSCVICNAKAHRTHLLEWVKIKGYCPICNSNLKSFNFKTKN